MADLLSYQQSVASSRKGLRPVYRSVEFMGPPDMAELGGWYNLFRERARSLPQVSIGFMAAGRLEVKLNTAKEVRAAHMSKALSHISGIHIMDAMPESFDRIMFVKPSEIKQEQTPDGHEVNLVFKPHARFTEEREALVGLVNTEAVKPVAMQEGLEPAVCLGLAPRRLNSRACEVLLGMVPEAVMLQRGQVK